MVGLELVSQVEALGSISEALVGIGRDRIVHAELEGIPIGEPLLWLLLQQH